MIIDRLHFAEEQKKWRDWRWCIIDSFLTSPSSLAGSCSRFNESSAIRPGHNVKHCEFVTLRVVLTPFKLNDMFFKGVSRLRNSPTDVFLFLSFAMHSNLLVSDETLTSRGDHLFRLLHLLLASLWLRSAIQCQDGIELWSVCFIMNRLRRTMCYWWIGEDGNGTIIEEILLWSESCAIISIFHCQYWFLVFVSNMQMVKWNIRRERKISR